jgi:divalent metal cation (Fe/Co/Zn/Cd) transporter
VSTPELTLVAHASALQRDPTWLRAARRARLLSWVSLGWMAVEGAVGVVAGVLAGSVALLGFGLDSAIEGLASVIVIWRFTGARTHSETSERRAQRAVAISFLLLAPYIAVDAMVTLASASRPETSWVGIGLAAGSIALMPALARAKRRLGRQLDSAATAGEGTQNMLCAYLAAGVLAGLLANALFGWWWLDPVAALFIALVAVREGRETWRGESCCE